MKLHYGTLPTHLLTRLEACACARTSDGISVPIDLDAATCWCVLGALGKVANEYESGEKATMRLHSLVGPVSIFNDTHTHAEVLALFDRAIEEEEMKA